nr:MAG: hypothetical protein CM15mV30_1730 [uncultured marine virus]
MQQSMYIGILIQLHSTGGDIVTKVKDAVTNYYNTEIKNFDSVFRFSKFQKLLMNRCRYYK